MQTKSSSIRLDLRYRENASATSSPWNACGLCDGLIWAWMAACSRGAGPRGAAPAAARDYHHTVG